MARNRLANGLEFRMSGPKVYELKPKSHRQLFTEMVCTLSITGLNDDETDDEYDGAVSENLKLIDDYADMVGVTRQEVLGCVCWYVGSGGELLH